MSEPLSKRSESLTRKAVRDGLLRSLTVGILLFVPAGTLLFWQGWTFLIVSSASHALVNLAVGRQDPNLLEERVSIGPRSEGQRVQQLIHTLTFGMFAAAIIIPALNYRLAGSSVPVLVVALGNSLVILGFWIRFVVFRENSFCSATIKVSADQTVVSTGPYAWVRHPMYSSVLVTVLGMTLALGSWWGGLVLIPLVALIGWRLIAEEEFLEKGLSGYSSYCQQVSYRLVPGVW